MHDYNVDKKVDMFIKAAREQASQVKNNKWMAFYPYILDYFFSLISMLHL